MVVVFVVACAKGGNGNPQVDASSGIDSPRPPVDAPSLVDARMIDAPMIDAPPVMIDAQMVDAPSGPFCTQNSNCTTAGQCCLAVEGVGFCIEGTPIGQNICIPPL
jgi:hypothetical protein